MNKRMLEAFALYEHSARIPDMHNIMQQYPGTRLYRGCEYLMDGGFGLRPETSSTDRIWSYTILVS